MGILSICTLMYLKYCLRILRAFRLFACGHIHSIAWHSKGIFLWMHKSAIAFWCRVQNCGVGLSGYIVCICNCTCCNHTIPRWNRGWKQDVVLNCHDGAFVLAHVAIKLLNVDVVLLCCESSCACFKSVCFTCCELCWNERQWNNLVH